MKKAFIGVIALGGVAAAGGAIGYPIYTSFVETTIADWINQQNLADLQSNTTYETLTADPLNRRVEVTGLRFEHEVDGTQIVGTAAQLVFVSGSTMLTNPREKIEDAVLTEIRFEGPEGVVAEISRIEVQDVVNDPESLNLQTLEEIIEADAIRTGSLGSFRAEGIEITPPNDDPGIQIGSVEMLDIQNGLIGTTAYNELAFNTPDGAGTLGRFEMLGLDMASMLEWAHEHENLEQGEFEPQDFAELLDALAIQSISFEDIEFEDPTGNQVQVGFIGLSDIGYDKGIPISASIGFHEVTQNLSPEMQMLGAGMLPFHVDIPETATQTMNLTYDLDKDSGTLDVTFDSWDSITDVDGAAEISISGLGPLLDAIAADREPDFQNTRDIALDRFTFSADTREAWTPPAIGESGRPEFRMFAMGALQEMQRDLRLPPDLLNPVRAYLQEGGRLDLAILPEPALTMFEARGMMRAPPAAIIERISAATEHAPFAE